MINHLSDRFTKESFTILKANQGPIQSSSFFHDSFFFPVF